MFECFTRVTRLIEAPPTPFHASITAHKLQVTINKHFGSLIRNSTVHLSIKLNMYEEIECCIINRKDLS